MEEIEEGLADLRGGHRQGKSGNHTRAGGARQAGSGKSRQDLESSGHPGPV